MRKWKARPIGKSCMASILSSKMKPTEGPMQARNMYPGGTPILSHIRDVRPEPADGCKFLTKNLRMGHNFDIILPGNGWFSSKLNKTYCGLVNFCCK